MPWRPSGRCLRSAARWPGLIPADREVRLEVANCLNHIGGLLQQTGQSEDSMRHFREALAILEALAAQRTARPHGPRLPGLVPRWHRFLERRAGRDTAPGALLEGRWKSAAGWRRPVPTTWSGRGTWPTPFTTSACTPRISATARRPWVVSPGPGAHEKASGGASRSSPGCKTTLAALYNDMANVFVSQRDGEPEAMRLYREALAIRGKLVQAHPTVSLMKRRSGESTLQHRTGASEPGPLGRCNRQLSTSPGSSILSSRGPIPRWPSTGKTWQKTVQPGLRQPPARAVDRVGRRIQGARGLGAAVSAEPSNAEYRKSLADCLVGSARLLETEGKLDEALASHREAVEILRTLVQDRPHVVPFRDKLAACQFSLADCLAATGRLDLARQVQHEALAMRLELVRSEPGVNAYKDLLANGYLAVARLEVDAGRSGECLRLLEQAGAIYDRLAFDRPSEFVARGNSPDFQLVLAAALEASGDLAGACALTSSLASSPNGSPWRYSADHFRLACIYARESALLSRQRRRPVWALRAIRQPSPRRRSRRSAAPGRPTTSSRRVPYGPRPHFFAHVPRFRDSAHGRSLPCRPVQPMNRTNAADGSLRNR